MGGSVARASCAAAGKRSVLVDALRFLRVRRRPIAGAAGFLRLRRVWTPVKVHSREVASRLPLSFVSRASAADTNGPAK